MLAWEKSNHARLTVARPLLVDTRVAAGSFRGCRLRDMQQRVELGANFNRLGDAGAVRSTFLSLGIYNGFSPEGEMAETNDLKDVMLQALHLWGESNSVGAMWYTGKVTQIADQFDDRINRWAIFGNHRLGPGTDLLAGVGGGRDKTTASSIGSIPSRGWFVELTQNLGATTSAIVRYDGFERNRSVPARDLRGPTIGVKSQVLENLLLMAQYRGIRPGSGTRGRDFTVQAMVVY